jgi:type I restriction enzyme R subunit
MRMEKPFRTFSAKGSPISDSLWPCLKSPSVPVVQVMRAPVLCAITHKLVRSIRASVTIDWEQKETVRAEIRTQVKRLLRRYKYPPDKQEEATETVLRQAELLCKDRATS